MEYPSRGSESFPSRNPRGRKNWQHHRHHTKEYHQRREGQTTGGSSCPVQTEVDAIFNKTYDFRSRSGDGTPWVLPSPETFFPCENAAESQDDWNSDLSALRSQLRLIQGQLSDKEIVSWHQHTASTHRGGLVMHHLRKNFHVELGTQAWCKFHEIVACRHLFPDVFLSYGAVNSIHICEAPGAFVTSLNHYIKSRREMGALRWKWMATSLNPHYEGNAPNSTIVDDRLILQTADCWYFGQDNTGNVMSVENLRGLQKLAQERMGDVHLVTGDGSVNCQDDPAHQEQRVFPLLYCQAMTAFQLLIPGGAFLLKMFTMYNANTAALMYILNCAFKFVTVVKPACSKAGNSEVYVVCRDFCGRERLQPQLETLLQHFGQDAGNTLLFHHSHLPPNFVRQLEQCSTKFTECQIGAITQNLELHGSMQDSIRQHIDQVRKQCLETYVERCQMRSIKRHQKLMPNFGAKGTPGGMFVKNLHNRLHGSLDERSKQEEMSWKEQMASIRESITKQDDESRNGNFSRWNRGEASRGSSGKWRNTEINSGKNVTDEKFDGKACHKMHNADLGMGDSDPGIRRSDLGIGRTNLGIRETDMGSPPTEYSTNQAPCRMDDNIPEQMRGIPTPSTGSCPSDEGQHLDEDASVGGNNRLIVQSLPEPWHSHSSDQPGSWKLVTGQPLRAVYSSPFCKTQLMEQWGRVWTRSEVLSQELNSPNDSHVQPDLSPEWFKVISEELCSYRSSNKTVPCSRDWLCVDLTDTEIHNLNQVTGHPDTEIVQYGDWTTSTHSLDKETTRCVQISTANLLQSEMLKSDSAIDKKVAVVIAKICPAHITVDITEPCYGELGSKLGLVATCLLAVKILQPRGSLFMWVPSILTRFSSCLLYVLNQTFHQVTVMASGQFEGIAVQRVLVSCVGYWNNPAIGKHIQRVYDQMQECQQEGSHDVLQFVPMATLYEHMFDQALSTFNHNVLRCRMLRIIDAELQRQQDDSMEH